MVARLLALALPAVFIVAGTGCRAIGVGDVARPSLAAAPNRPRLASAEVVNRINQNARLVRGLKAKTNINVSVAGRHKDSVEGRLAVERPRNFKLELHSIVGKEADLGSNQEGFWFYVKRTKEREYYVCEYDSSGESPMEGALQPDWIVEALGLHEITDAEARTISLARGNGPYAGTFVLSQKRPGRDGRSYIKETIVNENPADGLIREHRLYVVEGGKKALAAKAVVLQSKAVPIPSTGGEGAEGSVILPQKFELTWVQEQLQLTVVLSRPEINPKLAIELFDEPKFPGFARVNLAEQAGLANGPAPPSTSVRETRPLPSGVKLRGPEPLGPDGASRTSRDPRPLEPDLPEASNDSRPEAIISARLPRPPASAGWPE